MAKQTAIQKTKNYSVKPTEKHKKAFKNLVENGGNKGMAIKDAGYSHAVVKTPQKVTESKGWNELLESHLPDKDLAEVHKEGLQATKKEFRNNNETGKIECVDERPDHIIRHKFLETAYKIKGKMKEGGESPLTFNWLQILYAAKQADTETPEPQRVADVKHIQDNKQEGEADNIRKKPSAKTIQRGEGTEEHNPQITPAWVYNRRGD